MAVDIENFRRTLVSSFNENGYIIISKMLNQEISSYIRKYIEENFSESSEIRSFDVTNDPTVGSIKLDVFNRYHDIYRYIFFKTAFIFHLKLLLGDNFIIFPETGIHKNSFGGWHKDVNAQQSNGLTFHWEDDFQMVTIGFYFQKNTTEYGGGLEVIPGSHKIKFPQYPKDFKGTLLASEPGDVVIFDPNLDHKASWPSCDIPNEHTKYSLFFGASKNNAHARKYMDFLKIRPIYSWMKEYSYPEDLVDHAKKEGYTLAV